MALSGMLRGPSRTRYSRNTLGARSSRRERFAALAGGGLEQRAQRLLLLGQHLAAAAAHRDARRGGELVELVLGRALAVPPRERGQVPGRVAAAAEQVRA